MHFPDSGHDHGAGAAGPGGDSRRVAPSGHPVRGRPVPGRRGRERGAAAARGDTRARIAARADLQRGRVMTLPQGVSKATGLHAALDMLRLSAAQHARDRRRARTITSCCGSPKSASPCRGAAPRCARPPTWCSRARGRRAVADYIRGARGRRTAARRRAAAAGCCSGYTEDGREFSLAVRGRNVLVAGDAKSGKSWVAGLLCEQLILHGYCVCVIDPEGDYRSLEALPGVTVLGGEDPPPTPRELLRALRYPDRSVVIDLSRLPQDEKIEYIRDRPARAQRDAPSDRPAAPHRPGRGALLPARRRRGASARLSSATATPSSPTARRGCRRRCSPPPK